MGIGRKVGENCTFWCLKMDFEILLEEVSLLFSVYTEYFGFGTKYLQTVWHDINLF